MNILFLGDHAEYIKNMDYKLEGGALPPGSIPHPHQKGIKVSGLGMGKSMLFLVIASKWFSNIPTKAFQLF